MSKYRLSKAAQIEKIAAYTIEKFVTRQVQAQIKSLIYTNLLHLPQEEYTDEEVGIKSANVYQHIFSRYGRIAS